MTKDIRGSIPLFTDVAIQMLYTPSRGIPRVVNQQSTQALYDAAAKNSEAIEEGHIQRVLTDQEWRRGIVGFGQDWLTDEQPLPWQIDDTAAPPPMTVNEPTDKQRERLKHDLVQYLHTLLMRSSQSHYPL